MPFLLLFKRIAVPLLALTLLHACAQAPQLPVPEPTVSEPAAPVVTVSPRVFEPIEIIAVGDIMLGTDYPENRLPAAFLHSCRK